VQARAQRQGAPCGRLGLRVWARLCLSVHVQDRACMCVHM
jgi:hypothetical protein